MLQHASHTGRRIRWRFLSLLLATNTKILTAFQPSLTTILLDSSSKNRCQQQSVKSHFFQCNLFFRNSAASQGTRRRGKINTEVFDDLRTPGLRLPYEIILDHQESVEKLTIRLMTVDDINQIMPLCIDEFGTGFTLSLSDFPFRDLSQISNWWDRLIFEPMVALSLRTKLIANLLTEQQRAVDPAVLVLCRSLQPNEEEVIGMVELSLQPPEANKNPPPFPVPLWIKSSYCQRTGVRLQGWVTNLLIDPRCRGLGYAKILMAAVEGIAKSWGCELIFLHADADYKSGKIAQSLYKALGYEVVADDDGTEYAWMTRGDAGNNPFSTIRMIEGVALLCFKKKL